MKPPHLANNLTQLLHQILPLPVPLDRPRRPQDSFNALPVPLFCLVLLGFFCGLLTACCLGADARVCEVGADDGI